MNQESFEFLKKEEIQSLIEANLNCDPRAFALQQKDNDYPPALVPSQIKNLQKSKKKLPSFYRARCIIPTRAFEQCSSEKTASMRSFKGKNCLDLTCGLGVDTYTYTQNFDSVTSLERNPIYCEIAKYNFQKLGIKNITIINTSAEDFIDNYSGPNFDLIYADPSRRDATGKRLSTLDEFSPRVLEMLPKLLTISSRILFKLSPLFDLDEAKRVFPEAKKFAIVSVDNECKELLVEFDLRSESLISGSGDSLNIMLNKANQQRSFVFSETVETSAHLALPENPQFISEADVAFYKGRKNQALYQKYFSELNGKMNHESGFFFADAWPENIDFPGRVFRILETIPYKPKLIKKRIKALKIKRLEITQRYFPFPVKEIRKQLHIADGGNHTLICTTINRKKQTYLVEKL